MATSLAAAMGSIAPSKAAFAVNRRLQKNAAGANSPGFNASRTPTWSAIESSSFLGERVSKHSRVSSSGVEESVVAAKRGGVRCFTESEQGMRGCGQRIIFTPFGPVITNPNYGRSNARREWERRTQGQDERIRAQRERMRAQQERFRVQQERMREMIEGQMRASTRRNSTDSAQDRDMALLRELEKRLKSEAARRQEGSTPEAGTDQSVDDLMKELERRLRREKVEESGSQKSEDRSSRRQETGTVYDLLNAWMREWEMGVREERERLQKRWEDTREQEERTSPKSSESAQKMDSATLKERQDVYDPSELQKAEEEERKRKLMAEERSEAQGDDKEREEFSSRKHRQSDGTVVFLKNEANGAEVYLVGTSHVSQQSADEVREVIRRVRPDYVMVELDRKRYDSMAKGQASGGRNNPLAFLQEMVQTLANGNIGATGKLVGIGLSGFYRLLATRGLQPGQEFKVAIEEGKKLGAKIVLGDQDIDTTMKHLGEQVSMQDAFKFFGQPMPSDIAQKMSGGAQAPAGDMFEQLRDRKIVRRFNEEMEKGAPALTKVLIGERNEAMTKALRNLSGKVVAVVGLAHLDGMEQLWHDANDKFLTGKQ